MFGDISKNIFAGRKLLIATKHQKEQVIAPILEEALGVHCVVAENFDTDTFGTFSGEIERENTPLATVRMKCLAAMSLMNIDLAVASEGSFGPHPSLYFIPANEEYLILIDRKYDLEIIVRELSTDTNFGRSEVGSEEELFEFATNAKFPSHGLILRKSQNNHSAIEKGIIDIESLKSIFKNLIDGQSSVFVETDMRAMFNPTRMKIIEAATHKLVAKIKSFCPTCQMPGFGITDTIKGLPCERCGFPTKGILSAIYTCQKCSFSQEIKYPNNVFTEKAMYCDICNP